MKFNTSEKNIITSISKLESATLNDLLQDVLLKHPSLNERSLVLVYNKQQKEYQMGLTAIEGEDIQNHLSETSTFALDLKEFLKLIQYLEKNNYLEIVQTSSNMINRPLLNIGQFDISKGEYDTIIINDKDLTTHFAKLNCSVISKKRKLDDLIKNKYLEEEEIKYQNTLDITSTSAKNSKRLVGLNLLALCLSGLAIWYSFKTNKTAQTNATTTIESLGSIGEHTETMNTSLDAVSSKLKTLPNSIDKFEGSIDELTASNAKNATQIKEVTKGLDGSISDLKKNISEFNSYIQNYGEQLDRIVTLTDQQLKIWEEQQKVMLDEFERRPKFRITATKCKPQNENNRIDGFTLLNFGDIEADVENLLIAYENKSFEFKPKVQCFQLNESKLNKRSFQFNCKKFSAIPNQPISIDFPLIFKDVPIGSVEIVISYKSKYNSDKFSKTLRLKNCKK